jgi:NADPH:quinone reductase-like Zn-dependent oxidoreductase
LLQQSLLASFIPGNGKIIMMGAAKANNKDLSLLKEMMENNKIKSVIDKTFKLAETSEALRYLETGHARAKVVITM